LPGGDAAAQTLYESAVKQSFRWLNVSTTPTALSGNALADSIANDYIISDVVDANWSSSGTSISQKVQFIAYQKYIAMCGVDPVEAWCDIRRLGVFIPGGYLSHNPQKASHLPNVLTYPQSEATTNKANVPARSTDQIFVQKIFWQP